MGASIGFTKLALWMAIFYYIGDGLAGGSSIKTDQQDLQMKVSRKSLQKPAIKSVKTANGDVFECVDIYKQPAFHHPLLKNHTIQMRPSPYLLKEFMRNEIPSSFEVPNIGLKDGDCPPGTVPIRKVQTNGTLTAGSHKKIGKKDDDFPQHDFPHHHAAVGMNDPGQNYYGTSVTMNIWKPRVAMNVQFTLSQIWITAGPYGEQNFVEAGWHVYPYLNNDHETRMFVLWTANQYQHYCYNFQCEGYVQISQTISPGMGFGDQVSEYAGKQFANHLSVFRDAVSGNWLLLWGENMELIGYFPKELFNHLNEKADDIQWGGETYGPRPFPEMGSAHFPEEGFGKACFISQIRVLDQSGSFKDVDPSKTRSANAMPNCYRSLIKQSQPGGTEIWFGGPGGNCF